MPLAISPLALNDESFSSVRSCVPPSVIRSTCVLPIAPHAQILNYEGKNGSVDHADVIDKIVQDGQADIVTDSWGKCDVSDFFSPGSREHGHERELEQAKAETHKVAPVGT